MVDAFSVLRRDHEKVERTLATLEDGPNLGSGADQVELIARRRLTQQLIIDVSGHEAIEEQCFWPVVRERMPGGNDNADAAIGQEQEVQHLLEKLEKLESTDDGFEKVLRGFIASVREHVTFEETMVWPGLREALSTHEVNELGENLMTAKDNVPSRAS